MKNSKPSKAKFDFRQSASAILWFFLGVCFVVSIGLASKNFDNKPIESIEVSIENQKDTRFLTEQSVTDKIMDYLGAELREIPTNQVNLEDLKLFLEKNPYIEKVDLFVDMKRRINVDVWQKFPILRIITEDSDYYLSNHGYKIPKSLDFTSRVIVATGNIVDNKKSSGSITEQQIGDLFNLASFIYKDDVLYAMIEQIYVHENNQVELVSKLSDHEIILGNILNVEDKELEEKMMNLKVYFKEIAGIEGWDTHQKIDLTWPNQLIATQ